MTIPTVYDIGDRVYSDVVFTVDAELGDPSSVVFMYRHRDDAEPTVLTYGVDAAIVRDSQGKYHVIIQIDKSGTWYYRWAGTGAMATASEGTLTVRRSNVLGV